MLDDGAADSSGEVSPVGRPEIGGQDPGGESPKAEKGVAMLVLEYCDACLGPVGPEPHHVTELEFLSDRVLTWDFCSEECLLSGLND
jgi:hypothetical protein